MGNFSSNAKVFALAKEAIRGVAETSPTKFLAVSADTTLDYVHTPIADESIRGYNANFDSAPGAKNGTGGVNLPVRAQVVGQFLHMLCGNPVSAENAAFIVTSENNKIDFEEDGGEELTATLTAGNYKMGTSSTQSGTLCEHIKTQLEAVGDGTYNVTYNRTTRKITIAVSNGATAVKLLWKTGANGSDNDSVSAASLLGFTNVDTTSGASITSDSTTLQWSFTHTFNPTSALEKQGYTLFFNRGVNVMKYALGQVSQIGFTMAQDALTTMQNTVMFKKEILSSEEDFGTPSFADESEELSFQHVSFFIDDVQSSEVKTCAVTLGNGLAAKKVFSASQDVSNFLALKNTATGTFTIFFSDTVERNKFLAATPTKIAIKNEGDLIASGFKYSMNFTFDRVQYTAHPYADEDSMIAAQAAWSAVYDKTNSRLYKVELVNTVEGY